MGRAGLMRGPSRLNRVRMPSSLRMGPTLRKAGWKLGANRKAKFRSSSRRCTSSGATSSGKPRPSRASAEPQEEDTARLPCFTTLYPIPASVRDVAGGAVERAAAVAARANHVYAVPFQPFHTVGAAQGDADGMGHLQRGLSLHAQAHQEAARLGPGSCGRP